MRELINQAEKVLRTNWKNGYSIPCQGLYPFQWFWDSGFIAIGLAHFDMKKAENEIRSLLKGQWGTGFIPHINFHVESDTYFPGPEFHQSELNPKAPKDLRTTGLTQPPVTGFVLEELYNISNDKAASLTFIKEVINKVFDNHAYFYHNRDPKSEGLVYIWHNWEAGTDNSPMWDDIWPGMDPPDYKFERRDTSHVNPEQRPSKREYDHYLYLINIAKKYNYEDARITEHSPFLVQDPLFNAMLIKSNQSLIKLYDLIGNHENKVAQLKAWNNKAISNFNEKLFDESLGGYIHYDLRNDRPIPMLSSSSFAPLFANIPDKGHAATLVKTLMQRFGGDEFFLCASFDPYHDGFNPKKYWRGPVWINLNWIIYRGLLNYGFNDQAKRIKKDTIKLLQTHGFNEYFDPRKAEHNASHGAYGGSNFSWSAALLIDMLSNQLHN